jgi:hypothetical protein
MKSTFAVVVLLPFIFGACSHAQKKAEPAQSPPVAAAKPPAQPVPVTLSPKAPAKPSTASLNCSLNHEDPRKAEVTKKGSGCEVQYVKDGESTVIASSGTGTKHCEDVVAKIKRNLASAGYSCQ